VASVGGKILVIRGGAIGDFILTLPAIAALRRQFPQAHLEVLGYPRVIPLAGGLVNRSRSIEARALAGFFARNGDLAEDWADYFSEFDIIISYLYDPDEIFENNVRRCTPAQFIPGPHRADEQAKLHAARVYLKPLERLAIFDADHVPQLILQPASGNQPAVPAAQLALHPGSGSELKNWPQGKWAELLERLAHSTEFSLLLVGGEAEGERLQELSRHVRIPPARLRVAQSLPLVELARCLQACAAFIGHDSGISHLAAAAGLPGLILWGDTVEEIWRPPSEKMIVLRHPAGLASLEVREVIGHLRGLPAFAATTRSPGNLP
jgi:ADP-heptose:LPS heptosyltransferase